MPMVHNSDVLWLLFPGLGADRRQYDDVVSLLPRHMVVDYAAPQAQETIEAYASRMSASLPRDSRVVLCGTSFGGIVAALLAAEIRPERLVLISSTTTPRALEPGVAALRWLAGLTAETYSAWLGGLESRNQNWLGPLSKSQAARFRSWCNDASVDSIRHCAQLMLNWTRTPDIAVPVLHIHGTQDRLMPIDLVQPTHPIEGAGHLLHITHPKALRKFIAFIVESLESRS